MKYIELTQDDINYINNRAVICYYNDSFVLYEPIPESLKDYFIDRDRIDTTETDTTITKVEYDWENEKAYITIADTYNPGPHEFDCNETWTTEDCETVINEKFNI